MTEHAAGRAWPLIIAMLGCPEQPPALDAGWPLADTGHATADVGFDAGHTPCAQGCDEGWDCVDDQCVRSPDCDADTDCEPGQSCSLIKRCHDQACLVHGDCTPQGRCHQGLCLPRPEPGFLLERVYVPQLEEQLSVFDDPCNRQDELGSIVCTDIGFGLALLDFDGDHDLDLFIGKAYDNNGSKPACLLRNQSTSGRLSFVPVSAYCGPQDLPPSGGQGIDIEGDGRHELLLFGPNLIAVQRFWPRAQRLDLLALLPPGDERSACNAGSAVSFDFNYDGLLDVFVGCQSDTLDHHGISIYNLLFAGDGDGGFRFVGRDEWNGEDPLLLEARSSTLALGAADLDGNGLLDLMVSEDEGTSIPELFRAGLVDPGGVYLRCAPSEACQYRPYRLAQPPHESGGYMGSGVLQLDGVGEVTYFSNTGNNRMVQIRPGARPRDFAESSRTLSGYNASQMLFSWGIAVDDFDRDGRDDFMLAQGAVWQPGIDSHSTHFDALYLQTDASRFVLHSADLGLTPFTHQDSRTEARVYSSRALLKADLDNDGHLDFLSSGKEGALRWHREVPTQASNTPRCTLVPRARYSPAFGVGHALIPPDGSAARQWDSQGQLRSGTSPFVLSPWNTGELRFPSGASVPFDCQGTAGPLIVNEPEWLSIESDEEGVIVTLSSAAPEAELQAIAYPSKLMVGVADEGQRRFRLSVPPSSTKVMLRFGERWLPRWWEL